MKRIKVQVLITISSIVLALSACAQFVGDQTTESTPEYTSSDVQAPETPKESDVEESVLPSSTPMVKESTPEPTKEPEPAPTQEPVQEATQEPSLESASIPQISESTFSLSDIAPYTEKPYTVVNDNIPYFSDADLSTESYEFYSELDELGRCGVAYASIGLDIMPTEERGEIGSIKPSGWHTVKYNEYIDGNYLYNRCHLIGYQLSGENANEKNLITGTRYLNVQGMLPFENMVADYVQETENHVLYRVTPIFEDDNLVASGVLMEAESVEDSGEDILFCVYVYNVQPNIVIDYATGESWVDPNLQTPTPTPTATPAPTPEPTIAPTPEPTPQPTEAPTEEPIVSQEEEPQGTDYILNTNTKKFHYPYCRSVKQMKDKNKQGYIGNRDDIISMGYEPCKNCNP